MTGEFRGTVSAFGFLLDAPLLGEREARRRVMAMWQPNLELRRFPGGQWLILLRTAVQIRAELAPGLPITDSEAMRSVTVSLEGSTVVVDPALLPPVSMVGWIDIDLPVTLLTSLEPLPPAPVAVPLLVPATAPALREHAKIQRPGVRAQRVEHELAGRGKTPKTGGLIAQALMRTPASQVVSRQHRKYVDELSRQFRDQNWDDALRDAIAIGGTATGSWMSLRLPRRRTGPLTPALGQRAGGPAVPYGQSLQGHLSQLYRQAAKSLEQEGRIIEAAFVLCDLLRSYQEAVLLLERHRQFALAAELAEGHKMSADLVVSLWWRAGRRDRAVQVARLRGAFAATIPRLAAVDAEAALALRAEWVTACQSADDHFAAVEAAWPEPSLRPLVMTDVQQGIARGGPGAAALLAYLVAHTGSAEALVGALALLATRGPDLQEPRTLFTTTFAALRCAEDPIDRRLATAALRGLSRDGDDALSPATVRRLTSNLRPRSDPLAVADLPARLVRPRMAPEMNPTLTAHPESGQRQVYDAAALPGGVILVALGDGGARLLTLTGQTRTHWDVPCHQLVIADHGGSALLASQYGQVLALHHVDLATGKLRRGPTLAAKSVLKTFDGALLTVVDEDGIAFVDVTVSPPTALWRELDRNASVHDISRDRTSLTALVSLAAPTAGVAMTELWHWSLPDLKLRSRTPVDLTDVLAGATLVAGQLATLRSRPDGWWLQWRSERRLHEGLRLEQPATLVGSGNVIALVTEETDGAHAQLRTGFPLKALPSLRFPGGSALSMRTHGDVATVWDWRGRVIALNTSTGSTLANTRLMA